MVHRVLPAFLCILLLIALGNAETDQICPTYSEVPWYDTNATTAPFTWCKAGDVGRIPVPFEFASPDWAKTVVCYSDASCKGIIQAEVWSSDLSSDWSQLMVLYAANRSVLVVSDMSFVFEDYIPTTLDFTAHINGSDISYFRLVFGRHNNLEAVILMTSNHTWLLASIGSYSTPPTSPPTSTTSQPPAPSASYPVYFVKAVRALDLPSLNVSDVNYVYDIDSDQISLAISRIVAADGGLEPLHHLVSFHIVDFNDTSLPLDTFSELKITANNKPSGYKFAPIHFLPFTQAGSTPEQNRTLLALNDDYIVHIISPPFYNASSRGLEEHSLEWFDATAKTVLFKAPDGEALWQVILNPEVTVRAGKEVPLVWLYYTTGSDIAGSNEVESGVVAILLPEFAVNWTSTHSSASSPLSDPSLISLLNPLGLINPPCAWNLKMNFDGTCGQSRPSRTLTTEVGQGIRQIAIRNIPHVDWLDGLSLPFMTTGMSSSTSFNLSSLSNMSTSPVTVIFVLHYTTVNVFAMDVKADTPYEVREERINSFQLTGIGHQLTVSQNGIHVLPIVAKPGWELYSTYRYNGICKRLENPSSLTAFEAQVLEPWTSACNSYHREPAVSDFIQYLSICPHGTLCQSSRAYGTAMIDTGYHTPYSISMLPCQAGSICPNGVKQACPYGFVCPYELQVIPFPCPADAAIKGLTCFQQGLTAPIEAPAGTVPMYALGPPTMSPPGTYSFHTNITAPQSSFASERGLGYTTRSVASITSLLLARLSISLLSPNSSGLEGYEIQLAICGAGQYCPLGVDASTNRSCPAGTYCNSSSALFPVKCHYNTTDNYSSYCPEGSSQELPCPVGSYCTGPTSRTLCAKPYYCPAGTLRPNVCPAGYYCPDPLNKILCPSRHYCILGSISPTPCAGLSICKPGTKDNSVNFILQTVLLSVIVALVVTWRVIEFYVRRRRNAHSRDVQEAEKLLAKARSQRRARETAGSEAPIALASEHVSLSDSEASSYGTHDGPGYAEDIDNMSQPSVDSLESPYTASLAAQIDRDLHSNMSPVSFQVDIHFKDMGLELKGSNKKVLDGVTGVAKHGRVTAVMGPSGAGKTTFMSTLAGKAHYGDRTGQIWLNDEKSSSLSQIFKLVGYVPQDDIMLRELSVIEILKFNARLRLDADLSESQISDVVRRTIRLLGLYDIRHELIGDETTRGISGGQRKRVNIGMELVANPSVLFLDEPTSGLDATASLQVCAVLRRVAEEAGMTVVAVIHQPRYDIFTMFHDVLLLGKGGRTVYLGPTKDAVTYFENLGFEMPNRCNPADFLIDVVSGSVPRQGHPDFVAADLFDLWVEHQKRLGDVTESDLEGSDNDSATDFSDSQSQVELESGLGLAVNDETMDDSPSPRSSSNPPSPGVSRRSNASSYQRSDNVRERRKRPQRNDENPSAYVELPSVKLGGQRTTIGFLSQLWLFFTRSLMQQKRNWTSILTDFLLVFSSAVTFGFVFNRSHYMGPPDKSVCDAMPAEELRERCLLPLHDPIPQIALMTIVGLALPASMAALRVFGLERVVFWRESSVGSNTSSYFLGKVFSHLPSCLILPLIYAATYYNFTVPRMGFGLLYLIFLLCWFCASGFALVISVIVPPSLATISTVVVIFGMSLFSSVAVRLPDLEKMWPPFSIIPYFSFFRWLVEGFYVSEIKQWSNIYDIQSGLDAMGYKLLFHLIDFLVPVLLGLLTHIIALVCLHLMHRNQRK